MAWIECNQEISRHPKTRRLVRCLGISVPEAIGHLICLWHYALDFAQDGDLSTFNDEDIAEAAMWTGEPGKFVDALVESGYLDTTEEGDIVIHDWYDYAGKLIEKRKEDAERKRQSKHKIKKSEPDTELQSDSNGVPMDIQRSSDGDPVDVQRKSNVTVQYSNSTNNKRDMGRFTPPTPDDVKAYCAERHNSVDPERFINFYSSKGWMIGKNKMKDWKAAVRSWEKNEVRGSPPPSPTQKTNFDQRQYNEAFLNSFETDLGGDGDG